MIGQRPSLIHHFPQLFPALEQQLVVDLLSEAQQDLGVLRSRIGHLLLLLQQPLLQHQAHPVLPDGVQLLVGEVRDLAVPHLHRHWVGDEAA
jgi:hypothetical protein